MIDTLAVAARGGGAAFSAPAKILPSLAAAYATHSNQAPLQ